jgi:hypothetical protein
MGGLANESIFAIILQTFGELTNPMKLINESATLSDWSRMASPTSPYLFKEGSSENINIISNLLKENKYAMFLRKVHKSFPDPIIKQIMNTNFNHKYDILHNQAKKKHNSSFFCDNLQYFIGFIPLIYLIATIFTKTFMNPNMFT